jgi:hypothetical protein
LKFLGQNSFLEKILRVLEIIDENKNQNGQAYGHTFHHFSSTGDKIR